MGLGDFVPQAVVFLWLHNSPIFGGIDAKPARVIVTHRDVRRAVHHPAGQFAGLFPGQFAGQAGPPADADLGAAAAPVVAHARCRADQRMAIGG
jgi:hypothetical protein